MEASNNQRPARTRPIPFRSAVLTIDHNCQLGFHYLHLLINKEYQQLKVVEAPEPTPYDCTLPELMQLQALLPCRDPEARLDLTRPRLVLSFKQYKLLRKSLSKELRYLATQQNSPLKGETFSILKHNLTAVMEAMLSSTKTLS